MSSIEQRLADAISDVEGLINEGKLPDDAVTQASSEYDLRPDVLSARAEKALGNLNRLRDKNEAKAAQTKADYVAKRAIFDFAHSDHDAEWSAWFHARVGRHPTRGETEDMLQRSMTVLLNKLVVN